jgi:glycosyltransferase involved in cell wall biosynthesis
VLEGKRVAVVVPAHNEEKLIAETIRGIPQFVDRIYVVDDRSTDGTADAVRALADPRVELLEHERNLGVGGAILTGYFKARDDRIDVTAVMAADAQMDPDDLETLAGAVARGEVDYAKANRLFTGQAWEVIPRYRYLGNAVLSLLTKIASGYWHIADSQSGYTAISLQYLDLLDLERIYKRYGFPNDLLVHLNVWNARVRDYPSRPIYGVGERSGIRLRKVVPTISWLLFKGFFWRMRVKYVIRDFHPLVFFYALGIVATLLGLGLGIAELVLRILGNNITPATIVLVALLLISGSQFTLFAMWFDMESNRDLGGRGRRRTDREPELQARPSAAKTGRSSGHRRQRPGDRWNVPDGGSALTQRSWVSGIASSDTRPIGNRANCGHDAPASALRRAIRGKQGDWRE